MNTEEEDFFSTSGKKVVQICLLGMAGSSTLQNWYALSNEACSCKRFSPG